MAAPETALPLALLLALASSVASLFLEAAPTSTRRSLTPHALAAALADAEAPDGGDDAGAATDMAYNRVSGKGVIVLSNVTRTIGNDEIYQRLLQEAENCE